jgi:hypothetical protein
LPCKIFPVRDALENTFRRKALIYLGLHKAGSHASGLVLLALEVLYIGYPKEAADVTFSLHCSRHLQISRAGASVGPLHRFF